MPLPQSFWRKRAEGYKRKKSHLKKIVGIGVLAGLVGAFGVRNAMQGGHKPLPTHKTSITVVQKGQRKIATIKKTHIASGKTENVGTMEMSRRRNGSS